MLDHPLLEPGELSSVSLVQESLSGSASGSSSGSASGETKTSEPTTKSESGGAGRSGACMFFSADKHFVVKEVTKAECTLLRSMLSEYVLFFLLS